MVRRIRNGDREVAKDPRDSLRKDELIMGRHILIHIEDRCDEVRREVNREVLKKRQKKASTRLSNGVIVRQQSKSKSHHHVKKPRAFGKSSSIGCLAYHHMWKKSHRSEREACLWTQFEDAHSWGS